MFAVLITGESSEFKEKNESFVKEYTREFSKNWEIKYVINKTTNSMLSQIYTPNGKHALNVFRTFGEVVKITDMELHNYNAHSSGITTGIFKFREKFENADTLVTVTIQEQNNNVKVHGFHIDPIGDVSSPKEIKA